MKDLCLNAHFHWLLQHKMVVVNQHKRNILSHDTQVKVLRDLENYKSLQAVTKINKCAMLGRDPGMIDTA